MNTTLKQSIHSMSVSHVKSYWSRLRNTKSWSLQKHPQFLQSNTISYGQAENSTCSTRHKGCFAVSSCLHLGWQLLRIRSPSVKAHDNSQRNKSFRHHTCSQRNQFVNDFSGYATLLAHLYFQWPSFNPLAYCDSHSRIFRKNRGHFKIANGAHRPRAKSGNSLQQRSSGANRKSIVSSRKKTHYFGHIIRLICSKMVCHTTDAIRGLKSITDLTEFCFFL